MEQYLFRPEEHHRLYGCINISVDQVPLEKRQHITEGAVLIMLTAIYYILYIPCIPSMYRRMKNPCYRLLFFVSMVDCNALWVVGFMHGYFAITGVVFCSYPTFNYIVGCYIWGIWVFESVGQIILVINRCVSMLSSDLEASMFGGKSFYFWFGATFALGIYVAYFVQPVLFSGIYFSWFLNPYIGYREDPREDYVTKFYVIWDATFAVGIPALYILFSFLFFAKSCKVKLSKEVTKQQKMMLVQVFIISMLNFVTCTVYASMMYFVPNEFVIHFAQFCWFHIHGSPPVIYLIFNQTIRSDAKLMLQHMVRRYRGDSVQELTTATKKSQRSKTNSVVQS